MATQDYQISRAFKLLTLYHVVDRSELSLKRIGDKTIDALLSNGWATLSLSTSGIERYAIADVGRLKAAEALAPKALKRAPLKTLPVRLKTMKLRIKPLKRRP